MALRAAAVRWGLKRTPLLGTRASSTGRVLSEEERAAETMYIKKMEKEKLEKAARQGVNPEESSVKSWTSETGSIPRDEPADPVKNIAVAAGVVTLVAGLWWTYRVHRKVPEEEKE